MNDPLQVIATALCRDRNLEIERLYNRLRLLVKNHKADVSATAPEFHKSTENGFRQAIEKVLLDIDEVFGKNEQPF